MKDATIVMEDKTFYQNCGVDWNSISVAFRADIRCGALRYGGSTITQQLARNLFLTPHKTISRKLQELCIALLMNRMLPKNRILELYLNTVDYGMGYHGVAQASWGYFRTTPNQLTPLESALLVGIAPHPLKPSKWSLHEGEVPYPPLDNLARWQLQVLQSLVAYDAKRYPPSLLQQATQTPLERLVVPYRDAYDRGATDYIPSIWHHVAFYSFVDVNQPLPLPNVAPCLKKALGRFLDQAHKKFGLVAIHHLGVYNDRTIRNDPAHLSAHAYGQAIDIAGFTLRNKQTIWIKDHTDPAIAAKLLSIEALLKKDFDLVLDWRNEPKNHQTHSHCEVRGPRPPLPQPPPYLKDTSIPNRAAGF